MAWIARAGYGIGRGIYILLLVLFVCLPSRSLAQTYTDFTYAVDGSAVTVTRYTGPGGAVTIPSSIPGVGSVTSIGDYAFSGCTDLTSVTIPSSVTSIGVGAFYDRRGLTSVTIPSSVTNIGDCAFFSCISLTNVVIPNSVTSIGDSAFGCCGGLTNVVVPNSVTSIGDYAFYRCISLTSITVDAQNTQYSSVAGVLFNKTLTTLIQYPAARWGSYIIPSSVTSIGGGAFSGCSRLTNVAIPSSVTSIGGGAFFGCSSLTNVNIPSGITWIGDSVFFACSGLTSVTIPSGITSMGDWAFSECSSLTNVTIPSSTTSIGRYAFSWCSGLTSVTIPSSVTSIGDGAFSWCIILTNITVDAQNTKYSSLAGVLFNKNLTTLIGCPNGKIGSYVIPSSVTSIGDCAFYDCSGLTSVSIPGSVTSIGPQAFTRCSGLTSVTIPGSVTSIGSDAFYLCSRLTSVTIRCGVSSIGHQAFSGCSHLTNVTIPSSVNSIGYYAFSGCSDLTSAYFQGDEPIVFGLQVFDSARPGFSIYYPSTALGWTTPTWNGYPAQPYTPASLQVSIVPAEAVSAGAQWQVDGGVWLDSGTIVSDLVPGNHTIGFKAINGWTTPAQRKVTLRANSLASAAAATYVQQFGSVRVNVRPAFAVRAGAQWQVDGGTWQKSGAAVSGLPVGTHVVSFRTVDGLNTPSDQVVTVKNCQTANVTGNYPNPFTVAAGTYQGLFFVPGDIAPEKAGRIRVSITTNDTYSAQLVLGGKQYSASGSVSFSGVISTSVGLKSAPISVNFQVDMSNGNGLTGTVAGNGWVADALAYRTGKTGVGAGKYTLLIPGSGDSAASPGGEGYGSMSVNSAGIATLGGILADGTVIASRAGVAAQGQWPLYASLYSGKGVVLGWLTFSNKIDSDLDGQVSWVRQAQRGMYYPGGFTNQTEVVGSAYALTNGEVFAFSSGQIDLSEGNLPSGFSVPVSVSQNKVNSTNKTLTVTIRPASGLFNGHVANPSGGKLKTLSFKGAVLQKQNIGCGFFLGTNQSGRVEFRP